MLRGGAGSDYLQGDEGDDKLEGGDNNDSLYGNSGDDVLKGDAGYDFLHGNDGNDKLQGGADGASYDGGNGADILFLTSTLDTQSTLSYIYRFDPLEDKFAFSAHISSFYSASTSDVRLFSSSTLVTCVVQSSWSPALRP